MTRAERAVALHDGGSSCSQAVFTVFAEELGISAPLAHKLATGFGGGMGRKGLACGAVTGGVLALSMAHGSETGADQEAKSASYDAVGAFIDAIESAHGTVQCRTLLGGVDLGTEEGRAKSKELGLSAKVCNPLIAEAVEYLEAHFAKANSNG